MKIIAHRGIWKDALEQNSIGALRQARNLGIGIETDLRSFRGEIYLSHDPIRSVDKLVPLVNALEIYSDSRLPVFLNVKEDGLLPMLARHRTALDRLNYVFFDMSVPELVRYSYDFSPTNLATRFSDFEPYPAGLELTQWIWVDGFEEDPLPQNLDRFKEKSFAWVSPELHGRKAEPLWAELIKCASADSVLCTDAIEQAQNFFQVHVETKNDQSHSL